MRKFTLFLMSLLLTVGAMAQFSNDNLLNVKSGDYFVYHTDASGIKHYLQIDKNGTVTTVTENPLYFEFTKNASGNHMDDHKFSTWYKMSMNGFVLSNTDYQGTTITSKVWNAGWDDMDWAVQAIFLNEDEEAAIRLTNVSNESNDWRGHWFVGIDDNFKPIAKDPSLDEDLFLWKIVDAHLLEPQEYIASANLQVVENDCELEPSMFFSNAYHEYDDSDKFTSWEVLLDNNVDTYFHSTWKGMDQVPDYIRINLGDENSVQEFKVRYKTRNHDNSSIDSPLSIKVEGSNNVDGEYELITTLSSTVQSAGAEYVSPYIEATKPYSVLRFTVTKTSRDPNNSHPYFAISEFGIEKREYTVSEQYSLVKNEIIALFRAMNTYENNKSDANIEVLESKLQDLKTAIATLVPSFTLNVTDAGWATLYLGYNALIPDFTNAGDDAGAYIVTGVKQDGWLTMEKVVGVLPENTGIIVKANEDDYVFNYAAEATIDVQRNLLQGSVEDLNVEGEAYVLGYAEGTTEVVFGKAKMNGTYWLNKAHKAYLPVSALPASLQSNSLRFDFGTTAIEEVETENAEAEVIFDLTGRRVNQITKAGVYIVNGKKTLVK